MIAWNAVFVKYKMGKEKINKSRSNRGFLMHLASADCSRCTGKIHLSNYLKNVILFGESNH